MPAAPLFLSSWLPALFVAGSLAWATPARAAGHLCQTGEIVLFACAIEQRLVSVCAHSLGKKISRPTFRYGTSDALLLELPEAGDKGKSVTKGAVFINGHLGAYLRFGVENMGFVVFSIPGRGDGLVVEKDRVMRGKRYCQGETISRLKDVPVPIADAIAVAGGDED
ncbi:hypothetical protein DLREEDagrD3_20300 [Denitratisoma sp. agr-D3]